MNLQGKTCCALVFGEWSYHTCGAKAKIERDGKFYCGRHDPEKIAAKRAERNAKWDADWEAKQKQREAEEQAKREQERKAAALDWLEAFFKRDTPFGKFPCVRLNLDLLKVEAVKADIEDSRNVGATLLDVVEYVKRREAK